MSHRPWSARTRTLCAGLSIGLLGLGAALAQPVPISGLSSNPDGGNPNDPLAVTACNGAPQTGWVYRNSEAEPHLAVNPVRAGNLIAAWHQDRWSTGGAQSLGAAYSTDGGQSWTPVGVPFTRCAGAAPRSAGDYERASDPWLSFGPDGTAYFMALSIDNSSGENAMLVSRSTDGGAHWSAPGVIVRQPAQDARQASVSHDKNTLTADPTNARNVYASWTVFRTGVTSLVFSRSTDGGRTWSAPAPIATMGSVARSSLALFRQGAQTVVLPDGTLVNAFFRIVFDERTGATRYEQALLRSTDQVQAFLPVVAVNDQDVVGVLFYDFRNDVPGDAPLSTDVFLSLFDAQLNYLGEKRLTPQSFDFRQMVLTGARGYFAGDYMGLSSTGADFVAAFTRSNNLGLPVAFPQNNDGVFVDSHDRQSIVFVRQAP